MQNFARRKKVEKGTNMVKKKNTRRITQPIQEDRYKKSYNDHET